MEGDLRGQVAVSIVRGNSFVIFSRCLERREPFRATEPAHLENVPLGPAATNSVTRTCMALRLPHPSYPLSCPPITFFRRPPFFLSSILHEITHKKCLYIYIFLPNYVFSVSFSKRRGGKKVSQSVESRVEIRLG